MLRANPLNHVGCLQITHRSHDVFFSATLKSKSINAKNLFDWIILLGKNGHCAHICIDLTHNYSVYCWQIFARETMIAWHVLGTWVRVWYECLCQHGELKCAGQARMHVIRNDMRWIIDKFIANIVQYFHKLLIDATLLDVYRIHNFTSRGWGTIWMKLSAMGKS